MANIDFGLTGKRALVTGGSRGIGLECARQLAAQGARVVICARKEEGLAKAKEELGRGLLTVAAHVGDGDDVARLFGIVKDELDGLDILINNVGMNLPTPATAQTDPGLWRKIIDTNLTGSFLCASGAAELMVGAGGGAMVNISSIAASRAAPMMGVYGVAKAGLEQLTRVLAVELAGASIRVNGVAPGMVRTGFSKPFWSVEGLHRQIVSSIPRGRIAEPAEVAAPALFLASDAAAHITGQVLVVDGGASAK